MRAAVVGLVAANAGCSRQRRSRATLRKAYIQGSAAEFARAFVGGRNAPTSAEAHKKLVMLAVGSATPKREAGKGGGVDSSKTILRQIEVELQSWGVRSQIVMTNEAYTSQHCPRPWCVDDERRRSLCVSLRFSLCHTECQAVTGLDMKDTEESAQLTRLALQRRPPQARRQVRVPAHQLLPEVPRRLPPRWRRCVQYPRHAQVLACARQVVVEEGWRRRRGVLERRGEVLAGRPSASTAAAICFRLYCSHETLGSLVHS